MEDTNLNEVNIEKKNFLSKIDPIKKYKLVICFLLLIFVAFGVFSTRVIKNKTRFEVRYDDEFYKRFYCSFVNEQAGILEYLPKVDKISEGQSISKDEMLDITRRSSTEVLMLAYELENFYNEYYNRKGPIKRYDYLYNFQRVSFVYETHFKEGLDGMYTLDKNIIENYDNYYIGPKSEAIKKVISEYIKEHKEYFDEILPKKNKHFIRDGVWRELFIMIDEELKKVDMDYDFGENAPKELKVRSVGNMSLPNDMNNAYIDSYQRKLPQAFKIFDYETGIYIYYSALGQRDKLDIVKIEKVGSEISITIDDGKIIDNSEGFGSSNKMIIRGLRPGEAKNYKFNVVNTKSEEYKNLDEE